MFMIVSNYNPLTNNINNPYQTGVFDDQLTFDVSGILKF